MPSLAPDRKKRRARAALRRLRKAYPDAGCTLRFSNPLELLVATVLSAQCTDRRVNEVTPALFSAFPTAADYAAANPATLEKLIRPTGFFRTKARALQGIGAALTERFASQVPEAMEDLVSLPGVGRKTAHCVRISAYGKPGLTVDTHCGRVTRRLGLTEALDPVRVEADLQALLPVQDWAAWSHTTIFHGRACCLARRPRCEHCVLSSLCPSKDLLQREGPKRPANKSRTASRTS